MLAKAPALGADELVLDLEDAVTPSNKDRARQLALETLVTPALSDRAVSVRINAPRSPWCHLDVIALVTASDLPTSLVVPKLESAGDLAFIDRLLDGAEAATGRSRPLRLQGLIETARGLSRIDEIAAASPRLDALILGYADLAASLGRPTSGQRELNLWLPAQEALLLTARAHGLQAIDGPFLGVAVDRRFEAAAMRARDLGFDGKWAIHPDQVAPLNVIFSPREDELSRARAVLAALERAEKQEGRGAVELDGEMLDEAMRAAATRVIARSGGSQTTQ